MTPQIENPNHLSLPDPAVTVLEHMFATQRRVVVRAELGSGFSGSRVFLVHPISDFPELPTVVKMAPAALIGKEYQAYREYIHDKLSGAAEIRSEPTRVPGCDWGGLRYHLVGSGIFEVESLYSFFQRASVKDVWHVLEKRLFARIGPLWRFSTPSPQFSLRVSYDRLLPVNLLLAPLASPPEAPVHLLTPDTAGGSSPERGDYVRLEGFVVEEADLSSGTLTLNLPPRDDGRPASFRLRLQAIESGQGYCPGDVIDRIEGQVTATRSELLAEQVERVLGREIVAARALSLPGNPGISLPNPLAALPVILGEPRDVRVAGIHGDLNLENVLVDADARDVSLIDFGMARRDHVLHDLLRLETGVVTRLLPEILAQAGLPPETIFDLYSQVHHAVSHPGYLSAPRKLNAVLKRPFVILASIRDMARECLYDAASWEEYHQGLTLYLVGALKFGNLDEMASAPLPKQVAFWGAATAQWLLAERHSYNDATWQPFSAILEDLTGQVLGQYEIVAFIDQGSMGAVYRAWQARLRRDVAVKVMSPALAADADFCRRFEREAQSIAGLSHPNILTVHDYGETKDGCPYLVVDYVEGGTLRDRLVAAQQTEGGRIPLEEVIHIVAQVADALDYAHRQGVAHRDVKPNNILLNHDGRPLLADFGLVRPVRGDRSLTSTGMILGTPDYMAPEQAQGETVDGRADIYALGVMLFEMLTGRHPFAGETPISVIIKHVSKPLPRPSEIAPTIPPQMDEIVARATAKRPEERYQRAGDLAHALRTALAPQAVQARTPGVLRRPGASGTIAAIALLVFLAWRLARFISPPIDAQPANPALTTPKPTSLQALTLSSTHAYTPTFTPTPPSSYTLASLPAWQSLYDGAIFDRDLFWDLAIDPQNPDGMYANTRYSGIYQSVDGGASWQHLYSDPAAKFILDIAIDPDDPRTLYAVSHRGLRKTVDGGHTWQSTGPTLDSFTILESIVLVPQNSQHLYLEASSTEAKTNTLYESRDGGASWKIRGEFYYPSHDWAIDPQDSDRVYVTHQEDDENFLDPIKDFRADRSDGPGAEWQEIWQISDEGMGAYLAVAQGDPPTLYILRKGLLQHSQDGGESWSSGEETPCVSDLEVDPYDGQVLYCCSNDYCTDMRISSDGGVSWEAGHAVYPYFVASAPGGQTIYISFGKLLESSDRGMTWQPVSQVPSALPFDIQFASHDGTILYVDQGFNIYRSQDGGYTWRELREPNNSTSLTVNPTTGTLYKKGWTDKKLYRSTDGGQRWMTIASPCGEDTFGLAAHPHNGTVYVLCRGSTYTSTDNGLTWSQESTRWPGNYRLYFGGQHGEILYLSDSSGTSQSTDGGQHWKECGAISAAIEGHRDIVDLAVAPGDGQRVFVATDEIGVWASEDGCTTWEARNRGVEDLYMNAIAVHPANPDVIYAATNGGVYVSRDGGQQWEPANEGLQGLAVVYDVAIDPNPPHRVYVSTPLGVFGLKAE